MKIEIGKDFPQYFIPSYPEEFELFSHFETTAGIPTVWRPPFAQEHNNDEKLVKEGNLWESK